MADPEMPNAVLTVDDLVCSQENDLPTDVPYASLANDGTDYSEIDDHFLEMSDTVPTEGTLHLHDLPSEMLVRVLTEACAAVSLDSNTLIDVYRSLAPVCRLWKDTLRSPAFYSNFISKLSE